MSRKSKVFKNKSIGNSRHDKMQECLTDHVTKMQQSVTTDSTTRVNKKDSGE